MSDERYELVCGDALEVLRNAGDNQVRCVVTSPPYWGLRDYGTGRWEGGTAGCPHRYANPQRGTASDGTFTEERTFEGGARPMLGHCRWCGATRVDQQIGLEASVDLYVARLVEVFREVRRVLTDDGTVWLNLGDSYVTRPRSASSSAETGARGAGFRAQHGRPESDPKALRNQADRSALYRFRSGVDFDPKQKPGLTREGDRPNWRGATELKHKDLIGVPWRVAFALQADGWWLRSDIVWQKLQALPESVRDRPTRSHEFVFLLVKGQWASRTVQFSDLQNEYVALGQRLFAQSTPSASVVSNFCMKLAAALFQRAQAQNNYALPPFYAQEWKEAAQNFGSDFVTSLPAEKWLTAQAARLLDGDTSTKEFLCEIHRVWSRLTDADKFLVTRNASSSATVHVDRDKAIAVDDTGQVCEVDFAHQQVIVRRPVSANYFYDYKAVQEPAAWVNHPRRVLDNTPPAEGRPPGASPHAGLRKVGLAPVIPIRKNDSVESAATRGDNHKRVADFQDRWDTDADKPKMRNKRDVWPLSSEPFRGKHFAPMPTKLVEPCVLAGSAPGDLVLDPFCGSGTVGVVALRHGRRFVGVDLQADYQPLARERIEKELTRQAKAKERVG